MSDVNRREVLRTLAAAPTAAAAAFTWSSEEVTYAAERSARARADAAAQERPYAPRFFTVTEYATVVALADLIIPKDERSGSASEAGAPEFIDFIVSDQRERQTAMRGGLRWLDTECRRRFDRGFLGLSGAERAEVLDEIAYPARARAEMRAGVQFFTTMRDLVATGFWSSKMGVADIGYMGNVPAIWNGAPEAVLKKLGVREGNRG